MATSARPKLIALVSDVSARTQFILPNEAHINSLPFDGIVVNIPASWLSMSSGYVVTEADVKVWLDPLKNFNVGKENFIGMYVDRPADLFDDAAWAQVVQNWKIVGKVAAEAGFKGVFFDNEEYMGKWQDFPDNPTPEEAARGVAAYQEMAAQRGREIMTALAETMPNAEVAFAHGPYLSVPPGPNASPAMELQAGGPEGQELRGPFFTGFLEGMGPNQRLIDAGELYALRTAAEFKQSFDYRNNDLPGLINWNVDPTALSNWATRVDQGHMVYTDEFPPGYGQTPDSFVTTLLNAFDNSEGAVVVYSESSQVPWLTPNPNNLVWIAATSRAVELADNTQRSAAAGGTLSGTAKMDRLIGNTGNDILSGGQNDDMLFGEGGADALLGGAGKDVLSGGAGGDNLWGGAGADQLTGGDGAEVDYARYDDANWGNLTLRLDAPSLNVGAAAVGDTYVGIEGLVGGLGNDVVVGNASANHLFGVGGNDFMDGRNGNDYLNGGSGTDRFRFATPLNAATNVDTIADFAHGTDDILLLQSIFASIGTTLDATELRFGTAAADANDYIIYNSATGQLFYDANGNGAGGRTLFGRVSAGTVLDAGDFVMV
ncbi:MAG: hypothetical protein ACRCU5_01040 [Rhizobiaceae bacterium]